MDSIHHFLIKKCNKEFESQKGLINYCSLVCRNSRNWTEADKLKKSISAKNSDNVNRANLEISVKLKSYWSDDTKRLEHSDKIKATWNDARRAEYSINSIGRKLSTETIEKIRNKQIQRLKDNPELHPNRLCAGINESYPEKMVRCYFEEIGYKNGVDFIQQYEYNGYYIDFYLPNNNVCIEIDGEYWHDVNDIREIKRENTIKDNFVLYRLLAKDVIKKKHTKLLKDLIAGVAQLVECRSSKSEVAGSNPVTRSTQVPTPPTMG